MAEQIAKRVLVQNWNILWALTKRSIWVRYKQSALGIAWVVIQPLLIMLTFTLVFSVLLKVPSDGLPYPLFAYCTILPWTLFSFSLGQSVTSLEANVHLLKKLRLPRAMFPISATMACFADFAIGLVLYILMMLWFHAPFTVYLLYLIPIIAIQTIFTLGICFFLSIINAHYKDIRVALPLITQVWLYLTPIIYPLSIIPERFQTLYMLNPMAGIIVSYRDVMAKGIAPDIRYLLIAGGLSILMFALGYLYFRRLETDIVDYL